MKIHFNLPTTQHNTISSSELENKKYVLFFYPKDNTPGCSCEMKAFEKLLPEFQAHNTLIFGINQDTLDSHQKVSEKFQLSYPLISDVECLVGTQLGITKKSLTGKEKVGRNTFIIENGKVIKEFLGVKLPTHHPQNVLDYIKENA